MKKRKNVRYRYRSAITGRFAKRCMAESWPNTFVRERIRR